MRQYALVPATDPELLRSWWRVGFGQQHAHGIREIPETDWPEGVRLATEDDVDALVELTPLLPDHQALSPVFGGGLPSQPADELRADMLEDLANPEIADLVAERDGRIVGAFQIVPAELSSVHSGWRVPRVPPSSAGLRPGLTFAARAQGSRSPKAPSPGRASAGTT